MTLLATVKRAYASVTGLFNIVTGNDAHIPEDHFKKFGFKVQKAIIRRKEGSPAGTFVVSVDLDHPGRKNDGSNPFKLTLNIATLFIRTETKETTFPDDSLFNLFFNIATGLHLRAQDVELRVFFRDCLSVGITFPSIEVEDAACPEVVVRDMRLEVAEGDVRETVIQPMSFRMKARLTKTQPRVDVIINHLIVALTTFRVHLLKDAWSRMMRNAALAMEPDGENTDGEAVGPAYFVSYAQEQDGGSHDQFKLTYGIDAANWLCFTMRNGFTYHSTGMLEVPHAEAVVSSLGHRITVLSFSSPSPVVSLHKGECKVGCFALNLPLKEIDFLLGEVTASRDVFHSCTSEVMGQDPTGIASTCGPSTSTPSHAPFPATTAVDDPLLLELEPSGSMEVPTDEGPIETHPLRSIAFHGFTVSFYEPRAPGYWEPRIGSFRWEAGIDPWLDNVLQVTIGQTREGAAGLRVLLEGKAHVQSLAVAVANRQLPDSPPEPVIQAGLCEVVLTDGAVHVHQPVEEGGHRAPLLLQLDPTRVLVVMATVNDVAKLCAKYTTPSGTPLALAVSDISCAVELLHTDCPFTIQVDCSVSLSSERLLSIRATRVVVSCGSTVAEVRDGFVQLDQGPCGWKVETAGVHIPDLPKLRALVPRVASLYYPPPPPTPPPPLELQCHLRDTVILFSDDQASFHLEVDKVNYTSTSIALRGMALREVEDGSPFNIRPFHVNVDRESQHWHISVEALSAHFSVPQLGRVARVMQHTADRLGAPEDPEPFPAAMWKASPLFPMSDSTPEPGPMLPTEYAQKAGTMDRSMFESSMVFHSDPMQGAASAHVQLSGYARTAGGVRSRDINPSYLATCDEGRSASPEFCRQALAEGPCSVHPPEAVELTVQVNSVEVSVEELYLEMTAVQFELLTTSKLKTWRLRVGGMHMASSSRTCFTCDDREGYCLDLVCSEEDAGLIFRGLRRGDTMLPWDHYASLAIGDIDLTVDTPMYTTLLAISKVLSAPASRDTPLPDALRFYSTLRVHPVRVRISVAEGNEWYIGVCLDSLPSHIELPAISHRNALVPSWGQYVGHVYRDFLLGVMVQSIPRAVYSIPISTAGRLLGYYKEGSEAEPPNLVDENWQRFISDLDVEEEVMQRLDQPAGLGAHAEARPLAARPPPLF